jgi:hypothetical protein
MAADNFRDCTLPSTLDSIRSMSLVSNWIDVTSMSKNNHESRSVAELKERLLHAQVALTAVLSRDLVALLTSDHSCFNRADVYRWLDGVIERALL